MIAATPGTTTEDRLSGVGLTTGLAIIGRLRDGDELLPTVVTVTPVLDADGDALPVYKSVWTSPDQLPVVIEYLLNGEVVGTDVVVDETTIIDAGGAWPWAPSMPTIAALERSRTRGPASRDAQIAGEHGTFDTSTRPTGDQVLELIGLACGELSGLMQGRTPCTSNLSLAAATAAAYRTAMAIEASYYQEQTNGDQTAFIAFEKMWKDASKSVSTAVLAQCPLVPLLPGEVDMSGWPLGRVPVGPLIGRRWPRW